MAAESTAAKGQRLAEAGAVEQYGRSEAYEVQGDHDTYAVFVYGPVGEGPTHVHCTCPASTQLCSHVHAVMRMRAFGEETP